MGNIGCWGLRAGVGGEELKKKKWDRVFLFFIAGPVSTVAEDFSG